MNQNNENNRLSDNSCVKVDAGSDEKSPAVILQEIYDLHVEINAEQGQIVAHATEAEQILETKLARIKNLRHSVKGKQQRLKKLSDLFGDASLSELLTSR